VSNNKSVSFLFKNKIILQRYIFYTTTTNVPTTIFYFFYDHLRTQQTFFWRFNVLGKKSGNGTKERNILEPLIERIRRRI
jgi:hypothetical protein